MPTPRIQEQGGGHIVQGYTIGKTRGATILYGTPQAGISTLGWLQVVTGTGVAAGAIVGKGRQPDARPALSFVGTGNIALKNQKMVSALAGNDISNLFNGDAGVITSVASTKIDFGVCRAGNYIIMGANVNKTTGFVRANTYTLANNKNAEAVLAGASDTNERTSVHYRIGGNETKVKQYIFALTYSGSPTDGAAGDGYTYPVLTTVYTDGKVGQLDTLPTGVVNPIYSGTALSGLVSNESAVSGQAIWGQGAVITVSTESTIVGSGESITGITGAPTAAQAGAVDFAVPRLTLPGVICFTINGKEPQLSTVGYSISAGSTFSEDVEW